MSKESTKFGIQFFKNQEEGLALVEKLFTVAQPSGVYSAPLTIGEQTIITASEVSVSMGFGYGGGGGDAPATTAEGKPQADSSQFGAGGGGGGGGASSGRPVAVIAVGPQGVEVEPVVDVTKIALAFFTALGTMCIMCAKMRRAARH